MPVYAICWPKIILEKAGADGVRAHVILNESWVARKVDGKLDEQLQKGLVQVEIVLARIIDHPIWIEVSE